MSEFSIAGKAGQKQQRKLLATYVNVNPGATGIQDCEWELQGLGVESSAVEYNMEAETTHDITGVVETTIKWSEPTQEFDPNTVRCGRKLSEILCDIERRCAYEEYSRFYVLLVHGFLQNSTSAMAAEVHSGCTIEVNSLGGDSYVDQPFTIHFSNDKTLGTVPAITASPEFTASQAAG